MRFREQQSHTSETSVSRTSGTVTFILPVSTSVDTGFLFTLTLIKEMLMKRHLNTCYRLVWNHITGAFVVASELARARGKRGGVAVALSLCRGHVTPGAGC